MMVDVEGFSLGHIEAPLNVNEKQLVECLRYNSDLAALCGFKGPQSKMGFSLGYLSLLLVDIEGFPLGHIEAPLNVNE